MVANVSIKLLTFRRRVSKNEKPPGVRDLPPAIQQTFRNLFIRRMMKTVFSSALPWGTPHLDVYQHEFGLAYPHLAYQLHTDDAALLPVILLTSI